MNVHTWHSHTTVYYQLLVIFRLTAKRIDYSKFGASGSSSASDGMMLLYKQVSFESCKAHAINISRVGRGVQGKANTCPQQFWTIICAHKAAE